MPKITDGLNEVLADDDSENGVLGDTLTVHGPKPLKGQIKRRRRYYQPISPLSGDADLGALGVTTQAITPAESSRPPAEADGERVASLAVLPGVMDVLGGAVKGGVYGALLGQGTAERRILGGAGGGAVAFPVLAVLSEWAKSKLVGGRGANVDVACAVVDGVAHVGGAAVSVAAAGGEAADGAIAGTLVVVGSHVIDWFVGR